MYNENEKVKAYRKANNNPVPVRFGGLKPLIQCEAMQGNQSMNYLIKKIVKDYFEAKGIMIEVMEED